MDWRIEATTPISRYLTVVCISRAGVRSPKPGKHLRSSLRRGLVSRPFFPTCFSIPV